MVLSKYGENMDQRTHHLLVISNAAKMNYLSVRVSRTKRNKKRGWAEGGAKEGGGGGRQLHAKNNLRGETKNN